MPASARRSASWPRPIAYELVRSRYMRLDAFDADAASALLEEMSAEAHGAGRAGRRAARPTFERRAAFMRYVGQGHEITVELPQRPLAAADAAGAARGLRARLRARCSSATSRMPRSRS